LIHALRSVGDLAHIGSIAYKLAMVSAGDADLVISLGPKCEWDLCAGELLVSEAGGIMTDLNGDPLLYDQKRPRISGVIAAHEKIHQRALTWIQGIAPSLIQNIQENPKI
jgi:fructose-1,6-bisphosphatase/inositol monophosphatase family enzyme